MTCSIQITSVSGKRSSSQVVANSLTVFGKAEGCTQINVTIRCNAPLSGTTFVDQATGEWSREFSNIKSLECPCSGNVSVTAECVADPTCNAEASFQLPCTVVSDCPYVDNINVIIDLDPLCVNGKTTVPVILNASGAPNTGLYEWDFGDGTNFSGQNQITVTHDYEFPGSYNAVVKYTPSKAGCSFSSGTAPVVVPDCTTLPQGGGGAGGSEGGGEGTGKSDGSGQSGTITGTITGTATGTGDGGQAGPSDEGGAAGCDALLLAAIGTAIAGGVMTAVGVCGKMAVLTYIGLAMAVLGLALFGLWYLVCGLATACSVMKKLHTSMVLMVIIAPVGIGVVGLATKSVECAGAVGVFFSWVASLSYLLGMAMKKFGCDPSVP